MIKTGIVVIGMQDDHWCTAYRARIDELAPRLGVWLALARERGAEIVFPGEAQSPGLPNTVPLLTHHCACPLGTCIYCELWTRLHPALGVQPKDWVGNCGALESYLPLMGVERLLYAGAGLDNDVLFHPYGAVAMRKHYDVVLVRDMLLSLHANPSIPLSHALSSYQIPSVMSEEAFA